MAVTGFTFDKAIVPANRDSILYDKFNFGRSSVVKGRYNDMELTSNGLNVTVDTGYAIVQGRLIEISSPEIIPVPANTTGYIAITLDLSQENKTTGTPGQPDYTFQLNQGKVGFVKTLVSEDTNDGRPIFTFKLAQVSSNGTDVTITKNWDVYNNYVLAPDGVIFGDNVNDYGSTMNGNTWHSGGSSGGDLEIEPESGSKVVVKEHETNVPAPIDAGSISGYLNPKPWKPNTAYKIGDIVYIGSLGSATTGLITSGLMRASKNHTSGQAFPSSSDGSWVLLNADAYYRHQPIAGTGAFRNGFHAIRRGWNVEITFSGSTNDVVTVDTTWDAVIANANWYEPDWRATAYTRYFHGSVQTYLEFYPDGATGVWKIGAKWSTWVKGNYVQLSSKFRAKYGPEWQSGTPS